MEGDLTQPVSGWGRQPVVEAGIRRPRDLESLRAAVLAGGEGRLARGAGRSYGDAAVGPRLLDGLGLRHLLAFDETTGVLRAEGGVTLDEVLRFALPRGWFLPVTPGTKFPTLAGCVAADVHGKNHHADGALSAVVESLEMVLADGRSVTCSRQQWPELFWATLGGMGLTGVVYALSLRLRAVHSAWIDNVSLRTRDLAETCAVLRETQQEARYSVAWIDTLSRRRRGRGLVLLGEHAEDGPLEPLHGEPRLTVPPLPANLVIRPGLRLVNGLRWRSQWRRRVAARVHYDPYFYPLDGLAAWNRLYGPRGFLQFQVAVPFDGAEALLAKLIERTERTAPCALAVLKTFGDHAGGPLAFPLPGFTLCLDFPRGPAIEQAVREATDDVVAAGGRVYLAKDSLLTPEQFRPMYPRLDEFTRLRDEVDPEGRFRSLLSDRVGLT
jgi:decaprenylphospho-beta-D-ribofuranose 2-oxidase